MARVKGAMMTRKRRNATLKLAKGYWGPPQVSETAMYDAQCGNRYRNDGNG